MVELTDEMKSKIFISYSRDDIEFADQLDATLRLAGYTTTIDRHGIMGGEDWERRLEELIRDSDSVVFVLSPSSAASRACTWELEKARQLGKRIIPVACRPLSGADQPPPGLTALNYIYFYHEPKHPEAGFGH